jgi:hypothetical protein
MVSVTTASGRTARTSLARPGIAVLLCCCTGLAMAACSGGSGAKSPETGVTAPSVGKPAMAASIQAALAKQAFTPYAELGQAAGDGLAPNEATTSLNNACMTDAGYPNANDAFEEIRPGDTLTGTTAFGAFGYVGATEAAQYGFMPGGPGGPGSGPSDLSAAAQAASNKCFTIWRNFFGTQLTSSLAAVQTLGQTIQSEDSKDPSIAKATKAWSACMAADGYDYGTPNELLKSAMNVSRAAVQANTSLTTAQQAAQIADAEADAACTLSTDLAGIYFAVQAGYEQQIVDANQPELTKAVQPYRAAYRKELGKLQTLLTTTPTTAPGNGPNG